MIWDLRAIYSCQSGPNQNEVATYKIKLQVVNLLATFILKAKIGYGGITEKLVV